MTTIVVPAELPDGAVLPALQPEPLSSLDAAALYRASLVDVCETVQHGEADILVNHPARGRAGEDADPEAELRGILDEALSRPESVRYEVKVGETDAGRIGNALTHLLETEDEQTVGVVEPTVPLLRREHVGTIAMKLRTSDVVLGPTAEGGLYFAGFTEPVDFEDSFAAPAVETMTRRARDADLSVEFLPVLPRIDSPAGLATTVSLVRARADAGRIVPTQTKAQIEELGLAVEDGQVVSGSSDRS